MMDPYKSHLGSKFSKVSLCAFMSKKRFYAYVLNVLANIVHGYVDGTNLYVWFIPLPLDILSAA